MNIKWLEQNYSEAAQCYDLNKQKNHDYNSNRQIRKKTESPTSAQEFQIAADLKRGIVGGNNYKSGIAM